MFKYKYEYIGLLGCKIKVLGQYNKIAEVVVWKVVCRKHGEDQIKMQLASSANAQCTEIGPA